MQIAEQAAFLFVSDDELVIDENSWKKVLTTERANDVLDAVIEFVEHCEWSDEIDVRPAIAELGLKPGKSDARAVHRDRGHEPGFAALRLDRAARARRSLHRLQAARARLADALVTAAGE